MAKYRQPLTLGKPWFTFSRDRLASHEEFQGTSGTVETEGRRNVLCPKGTLKEVWTLESPKPNSSFSWNAMGPAALSPDPGLPSPSRV